MPHPRSLISHPNTPSQFDPLHYVIGVWLGDGSGTSLYGSPKDPELLRQVRIALSLLGHRNEPYLAPSQRYWQIRLEKGMQATFEKNALSFDWRARDKRLPPHLLTPSVVAGLWDTDGYVSQPHNPSFQVTLELTALDLVDQIATYLQAAGLLTATYTTKKSTRIVSVRRPSLYAFHELIPMRGVKRDKLWQYLERSH